MKHLVMKHSVLKHSVLKHSVLKRFSLASRGHVAKALLALCLGASLNACGGGGSGADAGERRAPDWRGNNGGSSVGGASVIDIPMADSLTATSAPAKFTGAYLPLGPVGAIWNFNVLDSQDAVRGVSAISMASVSAEPDSAEFKFQPPAGLYSHSFEFENYATASDLTYYWQDDGLYRYFSTQWGDKTFRWKLRLYAYPTRSGQEVIGRESLGDLPVGTDLNGDGAPDSARFRFSQRLVGYDDSSDLPPGTVHFRNEYGYTIVLSNSGFAGVPRMERVEEDAWLAPGLGPVRIERTHYKPGGGVEVTKLRLTSALVGSKRFPLP